MAKGGVRTLTPPYHPLASIYHPLLSSTSLSSPSCTLTMGGCLVWSQLRGIVAQPLAAQSLSRVQVQQQAQDQNVTLPSPSRHPATPPITLPSPCNHPHITLTSPSHHPRRCAPSQHPLAQVQPHHARRQEGGCFVVSRLCVYIHDPYIYMTLHHPQPPSFHPQPPCNHLGNPRPDLIEPCHRQAQPRSIRGVYATQCAITLSRGNPTL